MSKPICPWASIIRLTTILAVVSGSGSVISQNNFRWWVIEVINGTDEH
jgi:hypothetical protein